MGKNKVKLDSKIPKITNYCSFIGGISLWGARTCNSGILSVLGITFFAIASLLQGVQFYFAVINLNFYMLKPSSVVGVLKPLVGLAGTSFGTAIAIDSLCGSATGFQPTQKLGLVRDKYITYEQFQTEGKWKLFRVKDCNFDKYFDLDDKLKKEYIVKRED